MTEVDFRLRGEFITLDALLKATGLADSGGQAKQLVAGGAVTVDGQPERRRGAKLRPGQTVQFDGTQVRIVAASDGNAPGTRNGP